MSLSPVEQIIRHVIQFNSVSVYYGKTPTISHIIMSCETFMEMYLMFQQEVVV